MGEKRGRGFRTVISWMLLNSYSRPYSCSSQAHKERSSWFRQPPKYEEQIGSFRASSGRTTRHSCLRGYGGGKKSKIYVAIGFCEWEGLHVPPAGDKQMWAPRNCDVTTIRELQHLCGNVSLSSHRAWEAKFYRKRSRFYGKTIYYLIRTRQWERNELCGGESPYSESPTSPFLPPHVCPRVPLLFRCQFWRLFLK